MTSEENELWHTVENLRRERKALLSACKALLAVADPEADCVAQAKAAVAKAEEKSHWR